MRSIVGAVALALLITACGAAPDSGTKPPDPAPTTSTFVAPAPAPVETPVPAPPATTTKAPQPIVPPVAKPTPKTTTEEPPPAPAYYANCDAARAAGAAPLHKGEPGYRAALDRDNDGVACE